MRAPINLAMEATSGASATRRSAPWSAHESHKLSLGRAGSRRCVGEADPCVDIRSTTPRGRPGKSARAVQEDAIWRNLRAYRSLVLAATDARSRSVSRRRAGHLRARGASPAARALGRQPLLLTDTRPHDERREQSRLAHVRAGRAGARPAAAAIYEDAFRSAAMVAGCVCRDVAVCDRREI